jgi:hypothetical protein
MRRSRGAARRRGCRTSACQDAGFRAHLSRMPCHTAQALQVISFFASIARCEDANCLQFAATRLKFAARLSRFTLSACHISGHPH